MASICRRRWWCLQFVCFLVVNLVHGNLKYYQEAPASLGEIDHRCWEISSHRLLATKKPRIASTVIALWEFMLLLKKSSNPRHNQLFSELAQTFWDMYMDCMLSKAHGVGRRQLVVPEPLFTFSQQTSEGFANLNCRAKKQGYRRSLQKVMSA